MGPIEVVLGTHRAQRTPHPSDRLHHTHDDDDLEDEDGGPRTHQRARGTLDRARAFRPTPVAMRRGDVFIYDAALQHRGGANKSPRSRLVYYLALMPAFRGSLPLGLPYTIQPEDAGCALLTTAGVDLRSCLNETAFREMRTQEPLFSTAFKAEL
eukprot:3587918-Pleurochrysis_carterae.AAC.1